MSEEQLFPTSTPEAQGLSSADILSFLKAIEAANEDGLVDLHSFQIIKNGYLVAGGAARPLTMKLQHRIYSAAKGFVAISLLLALQEGIVSLDEKLVDIFPEKVPENIDERMTRVTVYNLLTMNSGQEEDTAAKMFRSDNWIKCFMEIAPTHEPGTFFYYNNGIPHILAAIVEKRSGKDWIEYMRPTYLDPLGIDITCRKNKQGEMEPSTVCVTQEGMTRTGMVFMNHGMWQGKQLIKPELVELFGQYHVPTVETRPDERSRWGYGFQVWKMPLQGFAFRGGNDNYILIGTENKLMFACESCNKKSHQGYNFLQMFYEMVYIKQYCKPIAENPKAYADLCEYLENWNLAPRGSDRTSLADEISGVTWNFEENVLGNESIRFDFDEAANVIRITTKQNDGEHCVLCGTKGTWPESQDYCLIPENYSHGNFTDGNEGGNMLSGAWTDRTSLHIYGRSYKRIESDKFRLSFNKDELTISILTPALALPGVTTNRKKGEFVLRAKKAW